MEKTETWAYDKTPRFDREGKRWHFVRWDIIDRQIPYEERPLNFTFVTMTALSLEYFDSRAGKTIRFVIMQR